MILRETRSGSSSKESYFLDDDDVDD